MLTTDRKDLTSQHPHGLLHVEEVASGNDGPLGGPGVRTLAQWRTYFADNGYVMTGPTGHDFTISLDPWNGRPGDIWLAIYVEYVDPARIGTKDPHGRPRSR